MTSFIDMLIYFIPPQVLFLLLLLDFFFFLPGQVYPAALKSTASADKISIVTAAATLITLLLI